MTLKLFPEPIQMTLFATPAAPSAEEIADQIEREFFPTPEPIIEFAVGHLWKPSRSCPLVLDVGAGTGNWGKVLKRSRPGSVVVGVDLPRVARVPAYDFWYGSDFRQWAHSMLRRRTRFDLVMSNPPFSLFEEFIPLSLDLLRPGGWAIYFLRLAALAGQNRGRDLWKQCRLRALTVSAKRPSFTSDGISDPKTEYALFFFQQGYSGPMQLLPSFNYDDRSTWSSVVDELHHLVEVTK